MGEAGASPSCLQARGKVNPGQVANLSQADVTNKIEKGNTVVRGFLFTFLI